MPSKWPHPGALFTGSRAGTSTRHPAVAGSFYPAEPAALRDEVARCLADARPSAPSAPPKMLVVPHAGTTYSGPVAASAYGMLAGAARERIRRVVLLGPAHRVPVRGLAAPTVSAFATPLGDIPLDQAALSALAELPFVERSDRAHEWEHSLELQLPFLQQVLGRDFTLVPLVVGDARPNEVAQVLEQLWGGEETLVLISSDLSHYLPYAAARERDSETIQRLLAFDSAIEPDEACGCHALNGALIVAQRHGLQPRLLDARNSGDTAGDRRRVVGYASLAFEAPAGDFAELDEAAARADERAWGRAAFAVARNAIARALGELLIDEPPHPLLDAPGVCFVSLHGRDSELRGCIGRLEPEGLLREELRSNARSAAFRDSRFAPLSAHEWPGLRIEVSLLGPMQPVPVRNEAEALAAVRPGIDGLVISWHGQRATLLPQVWQQLPAPSAFFAALKHKAGLRTDFWAPDVELQRFEVRHYEGTA
jgi:MEMO1 family protein